MILFRIVTGNTCLLSSRIIKLVTKGKCNRLITENVQFSFESIFVILDCGKPQIQGARVIAGTTAVKGSWPWQILMMYNGRAGCGGSLVSPSWVVTAAHCVSGKERNPGAFSIR